MATPSEEVIIQQGDDFITYEVFHQKKKGTQHIHVGIVHAPNAEMAMVMAKETFARRGATTCLWVVKSSEVLSTAGEDEDIFATTPEKIHREPGMYKTREKIEQFTKEQSNA
jgi:ring-1,2-phenylacetyl-CoA epoxidase subunit PaaB